MDNLHIGLNHFLALGAILFTIGLYGIISGKSAFTWLTGIQFMLTSINICFAALSKYQVSSFAGQIMTVFIIILGTIQIAIAAFFTMRLSKFVNHNDAGEIK